MLKNNNKKHPQNICKEYLQMEETISRYNNRIGLTWLFSTIKTLHLSKSGCCVDIFFLIAVSVFTIECLVLL